MCYEINNIPLHLHLAFNICKITLGPIKMDNEVPTVTITLFTVVSSMQISNVGQMFRCKL